MNDRKETKLEVDGAQDIIEAMVVHQAAEKSDQNRRIREESKHLCH